MTGGRDDGGTVSPWRGTVPELLIAAALVLVLAVAGYAMAGWAGLVHRGVADFALFLAIAGVAAGALRLALITVPVPEGSFLLPAPRSSAPP